MDKVPRYRKALVELRVPLVEPQAGSKTIRKIDKLSYYLSRDR
jgi:hypothetical protein